MPAGAHSTASDFPRWTTAAFDALYDAAHCGTLTMDSGHRGDEDGASRQAGLEQALPNAWAGKNVPARFTSMTLRHCSAVTLTESSLISMPAAVTSTCGTPSRLRTDFERGDGRVLVGDVELLGQCRDAVLVGNLLRRVIDVVEQIKQGNAHALRRE